MNLDTFATWLRQQGADDAQLALYRQGALALWDAAQSGRVRPRHVDQVIASADAARAPVHELATLKRIGDAVLRFQDETAPRPVHGSRPPVAPPASRAWPRRLGSGLLLCATTALCVLLARHAVTRQHEPDATETQVRDMSETDLSREIERPGADDRSPYRQLLLDELARRRTGIASKRSDLRSPTLDPLPSRL